MAVRKSEEKPVVKAPEAPAPRRNLTRELIAARVGAEKAAKIVK
jgi:hypothetical protein